MADEQALTAVRRELASALRGGMAHAKFEEVVTKFPAAQRGERASLPYSAWQLVEHIRLAQADILAFCRNHDGSYRELRFPDDYWPRHPVPRNDEWEKSVAGVLADRETLIALVTSADQSLTEPFPWGNGQSLLHEAVLVIDHTAYHTGELVTLRRALGLWPPG